MIIQPPSVLLAGGSGTGKTSALATQLLHGLRVFVIVTEPDGVSSLVDAVERLKAPMDKLHWAQCFPHAAGWMELEDMIHKVSTMDQKQLADQRNMGRNSFEPAAKRFLSAFKNFHCDRTGEDFGDVSKWDDSCSLNIDSLTGWCAIGFGCTVGYKPTANPGEWGIAQNVISSMLMKIQSDRQCFFSMTAHTEKEMDEMTGIRKVMVSAIGAKLAPKIPRFFGDVVLTERKLGANGKPLFTWSTIDASMDLKNRSLPVGSNLAADFGPVIAAHKRRIESAMRDIGSLNLSASQHQSAGVQQPPTPKQLPAAPMTPSTAATRSN